MSLQLTVDSLDAVPEPLRSAYEPDGDKFRLKVEGLEDPKELKSALEKERNSRKDLEKKIRRWESLGRSDEEIKALLEEQEAAAAKKAKESGDFDAVLNQHKSKWDNERKTLEGELNAARASERSAIIENTVMAALTKAGATEEGIDLLPDRFVNRIKFETQDGKRVVRIMAPDGETPLAGSGQDGFATFDDLVKEAQAKWPSLFKARGQGGSGTPPNKAGGAGARTITRTAFEQLSPSDKAAQMKAGVRPVD